MARAQADWITEIRYFYRSQYLRPLSTQAQALWHYLMYRENEAFWQPPIYLHAAEIHGAVGISLSSFKKARRELVEGGYLCHEAAVGNKAAGYSLLSCVVPGRVIRKIYCSEAISAEADGADEEQIL